MKTYLITAKQLHPTDNGEMNYCPYCLKNWKKQDFKNNNVNFRDVLKPITHKKYLTVDVDKDGKEIKWIDEYWECSRCSKHLTPDDYVHVYGTKSDGSKYKEGQIEGVDAV